MEHNATNFWYVYCPQIPRRCSKGVPELTLISTQIGNPALDQSEAPTKHKASSRLELEVSSPSITPGIQSIWGLLTA